jgi:hypothetical protein
MRDPVALRGRDIGGRQSGGRCGNFDLVRPIDAADDRVVGVDRCANAAIEKRLERMLADRGRRTGLHVAGDVCLDADAVFGKICQQFRIVDRMRPVADSRRTEQAQRGPDAGR